MYLLMLVIDSSNSHSTFYPPKLFCSTIRLMTLVVSGRCFRIRIIFNYIYACVQCVEISSNPSSDLIRNGFRQLYLTVFFNRSYALQYFYVMVVRKHLFVVDLNFSIIFFYVTYEILIPLNCLQALIPPPNYSF